MYAFLGDTLYIVAGEITVILHSAHTHFLSLQFFLIQVYIALLTSKSNEDRNRQLLNFSLAFLLQAE